MLLLFSGIRLGLPNLVFNVFFFLIFFSCFIPSTPSSRIIPLGLSSCALFVRARIPLGLPRAPLTPLADGGSIVGRQPLLGGIGFPIVATVSHPTRFGGDQTKKKKTNKKIIVYNYYNNRPRYARFFFSFPFAYSRYTRIHVPAIRARDAYVL